MSPIRAADPGPSKEGFGGFSRAYQEFITSRPIDDAYIVQGPSGPVKFDDFVGGTLIDAKGDYTGFINNSTGGFADWWANSRTGGQSVIDQALRQLAASGGHPVEWVISEPRGAAAFQRLLQDAGITDIRIVVRPMN